MSQLLCATAAMLALCGIGTAIYGISNSQFRAFAIGVILIFGSGVFATLYLGSRGTSR